MSPRDSNEVDSTFFKAFQALTESGLSGDELTSLKQALIKFKSDSKDAKLIRPIVPIEEWVNSTYYLGSTASYIYPFWKEHLINIWNAKDYKNLIIVSTSLGGGKTTFAVLIAMRIIYEYSCYSNFYNLFTLAPVTLFSILYFSVNKAQAEMGGWSMMRAWLDETPYFQDTFPRDKIDSIISYGANHLFVTYGSTPSHAIGFSVLYTIIDEASFMDGGNYSAQKSVEDMNRKASTLFRALRNRGSSRFMKNGYDNSRIALVSSPSYEGSFVQRQLELNLDNPHAYIIEGSSWDIKPASYGSERFLVFKGSTQQDACVVVSSVHIDDILNREKLPTASISDPIAYYEAMVPEARQLFLKVPYELKANFTENTLASLQDLAGVSINSTGRLYSNKRAYSDAINPDLIHPFTRDTFVISTESPTRIQDFLINKFEFPDKDEPHFIHIDQGVTTNFYGMSMSHSKGHLYNPITQMALPKIVQDFVLEITPPTKPAEIDLGKCLEFCIYLKNNLGVNITKVTFDTYQSTLPRQILRSAGIESEPFSVSSRDTPFLTYCDLITTGRLELYSYKRLEDALFSAIHLRAKKKVELIQSKDGSHSDGFEAAVGSVIQCLESLDDQYEDPTIYADDFRELNTSPYQKEIDFFKRLQGDVLGVKKKS